MAEPTGTFTRYPALVEPLPALLKRQRRLAARIAAVADAVKDEKIVRGEIFALLELAGLKKSDVVTCAGYDVRFNEKAGSSSINGETLTAVLVKDGVARECVQAAITASTETGEPSRFATVTPSKGAKVSPPQPMHLAAVRAAAKPVRGFQTPAARLARRRREA